MFQKSNPVDYLLKDIALRGLSEGAITEELGKRRKQVKLIFQSFMKRLKAAYKARLAYLNESTVLAEKTKVFERDNWAMQFCEWEEGFNTLYNNIIDDYLTPTKLAWGSDDYTRTYAQMANSYIRYANTKITYANNSFRDMEKRAFSIPRNMQLDRADRPVRRVIDLQQTKQRRTILQHLFLDLRKAYPYIRAKYKARLAKAVMAYMQEELENGGKSRMPKSMNADNFKLWDMTKLGVPAADVVGPWWPQTPDIKSPMAYIDYMDKHSDIRLIDRPDVTRGMSDCKAPLVEDWLHIVGLDGSDRQLREAAFQYYLHHKAPPSVAWARRRSNELEEERKKEDMKRQIDPVRDWLRASVTFRQDLDRDGEAVHVPKLGGAWRIVVPADAQELCERAQRDGLCVVDVISRLSRDSEDEEDCFHRSKREGVCTLLFSTDPKRRTIVGLDDEGICTSDHHCTGANNEVDDEAWEKFK